MIQKVIYLYYARSFEMVGRSAKEKGFEGKRNVNDKLNHFKNADKRDEDGGSNIPLLK